MIGFLIGLAIRHARAGGPTPPGPPAPPVATASALLAEGGGRLLAETGGPLTLE